MVPVLDVNKMMKFLKLGDYTIYKRRELDWKYVGKSTDYIFLVYRLEK